MSAPAIKSSMPGVGASPTSTGHSLLPMNMMAQKVVPGSDSNSGMKPLTGSGLNYVTLQSANHPQQPLSLVQDHRPPPAFQAPPSYPANNPGKEAIAESSDKVLPNGIESGKPEAEQEQPVSSKPSEPSRNNNLSPETPTQEKQSQPEKKQSESQSGAESVASKTETPAVGSNPVASKTDEKKLPFNNGPKETETTTSSGISAPSKPSPTKVDETQPKSEPPKPKAQSPVGKLPTESTGTTSPKSETKVTSTSRATKRKPRELKDLKGIPVSNNGPKPKRNRIKTQPYQSPLPDLAMIVKNLNKPVSTTKAPDDKLIVFYKNEFLAVRNTEGSFFVCQAMQNIYKSSRRIRIRWLSQDKNNGEIYSPDFYDHTDFDCILTNLNLNKVEKNKYQLTKLELLRTENILKRAIDVEAGVSEKPPVTEEHPDGLDLSLFKDEAQLKKRRSNTSTKQKRSKKVKAESEDTEDEEDSDENSDAEEKPVKSSASKKRVSNKTLAIAKSVAQASQASSRKERALNRRNKSSSEMSNSSSSAKSGNTEKIMEGKKEEAKRTVKTQSNSASGVTRTKARGKS